MSYRTVIEHALRVCYAEYQDPAAFAGQLLARYDAERPGPEAYPGELDMLRGTLATLHAVAEHGDLGDVRKLLAEHRADDAAARAEQGKSSRTPADATPAREQRLAQLLDTIRTHRGQWRVGQVQALRRVTGGPTQRSTARRDLAELARRGHLLQHGPKDGRFYTLKSRKDGA
ncbi:hypothetical protein ACIQ6R_06180 [Streptomyces sp. NPDC096048]|uniref:hypothetical protein n=1 Tax=Streptomyces sp. NPDC096048 TaxID=3366072 RepID=UPI0038022FDC